MLGAFGASFLGGDGTTTVHDPQGRGVAGVSSGPVDVTARGRSLGVQNSATRGFRVYAKTGGSDPVPGEDSPVVSGSSLPLEVSLADGDYRVLTTYRNGFGVEGGGTPGRVRISGGVSVDVPPPAPLAGSFTAVRGVSLATGVVSASWSGSSDPGAAAPTIWVLVLEHFVTGAWATYATQTVALVDLDGLAKLRWSGNVGSAAASAYRASVKVRTASSVESGALVLSAEVVADPGADGSSHLARDGSVGYDPRSS